MTHKLTLKFEPSYFYLAFSIIANVFFISAIFWTIDDHSYFVWIYIFWELISLANLFMCLTSIKKILFVEYNDDGMLVIKEKNLIGVNWNGDKIKISDIQQIWIYKLSINFVPTATSFKMLIKGREEQIFTIAGKEGYLPEIERREFLAFLFKLNPKIQFGFS
ncbi:MAG: hypothetical protein IPJ66_01320 [Bacteroidetes bacterium]|nr:hypothetical protein [Bacteroidota bacterium]MBL0064587.1 hypothetical protein [Bacteroidota bacterium]